VRKSILSVVAILVALMSGLAFARVQQTPPKQGVPTQAEIENVLKAMRADMQGTRADIMSKNLTLTAAQAAKFWPMFEQYQKEQNVIMDEQLKGIQKYVESYNTIDDAGALALMTAHLDRDVRMNTLRTRWLKEFQSVLPVRIAARAMQIDRRLSMVAQLEISSKIPLIH